MRSQETSLKKYTTFSVHMFIVSIFALPVAAQNTAWLSSLFTAINDVIDSAVPVLLLLAFLFFVYGMVIFIYNAADERKQATGRQQMFWGLIALFVLSVVWGILQLMQGILGIGTETAPPAPSVTAG